MEFLGLAKKVTELTTQIQIITHELTRCSQDSQEYIELTEKSDILRTQLNKIDRATKKIRRI